MEARKEISQLELHEQRHRTGEYPSMKRRPNHFSPEHKKITLIVQIAARQIWPPGIYRKALQVELPCPKC